MTSDMVSHSDVNTSTAKSLGDVLVDMGHITTEQLSEAIEVQQRDLANLSDVLVDMRIVSPQNVAMALSLHLNLPMIDLKRHRVQPEAVKLVPERIARKHNLIPLDIVSDALILVMDDPRNIEAIDDVAANANMRIQPAVGVKTDILESIGYSYRASARIQQHISDFMPTALSGLEQLTSEASESAVANAAMVQALDLIITQALKDRASDVHIEPQHNKVRIRYRIDGVLHDSMTVPNDALTPLISRIKVLAGMDITEHRRPQDGQFSLNVENRSVDVRVATMETSYGETAVLRVLDQSESLFDLGQLGLQPEAYEKYLRLLQSPYGIILVSGPTGSGKTTTLYASINQLDRRGKNIMTIEDPIEYRFSDVKQVQVNEKAGITFASSLRAMMRLDPDVILVGEIRDNETAQTAAQAALTGHLVLSSIHANDAASVPFRLKSLGVEPYLISSVTVAVIAQRMIRRICTSCSRPLKPSEEELQA